MLKLLFSSNFYVLMIYFVNKMYRIFLFEWGGKIGQIIYYDNHISWRFTFDRVDEKNTYTVTRKKNYLFILIE